MTATSRVDTSMVPGRPPAPLLGPASGLVDAKLACPWTRPGLVERTELLDDIAASDAPIVSVVAPAGYGKSTLLGQLAERSSLPTGWLSLDDADNDPALLFGYLAAALARTEPIDLASRRAMRTETRGDASWSLRRLTMLTSSMGAPFLLVLDHVEALHNPASRDLVNAIALNLPDGARLALGSRAALPIPSARLRARGQLLEVGADRLAMGLDEAAALVGAVTEVEIPPVALRGLVEQTEGWPVGLYLASLAGPRDGDEDATSPSLSSDDWTIDEYLRAEVMASFPPSTRSFLIRTSILDQLSGSLCDAVLATAGSHALLSLLEQSNLLLIPLDRQREWFRWHHLLSQMLRRELERSEPDLIPRLHDRAAAWFESDGQPERAIAHAMAADDADRAARLIATVSESVHASGGTATVAGWIEWMDERGLLERYPEVAVTAALLEALTGAPRRLDRLVDRLHVADLAGTSAPDGSPIESWISFIDAVLGRNGAEQMVHDARQARERLAVSSMYQGSAAALEGFGLLLVDDLRAADAILAEAVDLCARFGAAPTGAAALAARAAMSIDRGAWTDAAELADGALAIVQDQALELHVQATVVHAVAARVAAHRGDVAAAEELLRRAARTRPRCTIALPITAYFLLQLAHAHLEIADAAGARTALRQAGDVLVSYPGYDLIATRCAALGDKLDTIRADGLGASALTVAELRLLPMLATHLTYREIGERLFVSVNTVKSQSTSVFRKLGASSRSEAVAAAERLGLLHP